MKTKLSILREHMSNNDWAKALSMASKFQQLGKHKNAIRLGHEAIAHPAFYSQLGKNPDELRTLGIEALKQRYAD